MPPTTQTELPSQYNPADVEAAINQRWRDAGADHAEPTNPGPPYAIVIPPPNVTAALHLGHALNNTLQDVLIRHRRMCGDNAVWFPGTDHAGIATQTVVEKRLLMQEGKKRTDFERDAFVARVQAWKDEYEQIITSQLREMGCSCDWQRQAFTMDEPRAKAVREAFFRFFKDGLIYRGKYLVNWDPATQTALADDEVEMQDVDGNFYYMRYPLIGPPLSTGENYVTVATTRPETMLGDTAVAMHPDDPRAEELKDRMVLLPIVDREIPIVFDNYVTRPDPDSDDPKARMSSGFLKVTPAHDLNDWEIGLRHQLPIINVMAPDASISVDHGWPAGEKPLDNPDVKPLVGLSREDARKAIVIWFKDHGMMEEVKPYRHAVGHSYRSHVPIEPYYSDQWYLKVTDDRLRGAALRAMAPDQYAGSYKAADGIGGPGPDGEPRMPSAASYSGHLRFTPARYAKTFQTWHENIRDWCISRQLWWGHRIPVWSKTFNVPADQLDKQIGPQHTGETTQAYENDDGTFTVYWVMRDLKPDRIEAIESAGWAQDPDVLDTWFSSALWPMSTMGWPQDTPELETWNPTSVLCTAREIITLWVSRMVMFNLYFRGTLPFKDVFIHAMIQDGFGQKMSKSLGNGVDPFDIIHSHGADAMRFTLTSMTTHTQDVRMPVDIVDPHTGETVTPDFITTPGGHKVAAPTQNHSGKEMVSSFGLASGQAAPSDDAPLARNTSEKFDLGQRFANKMWNAVRFSLGNLTAEPGDGGARALPDRWVLSRLARTIADADAALGRYAFAEYATTLYDFFWRDLCDWYIEAIKPTVADNPDQQHVLATCIDASLRLLHPAMPFITERLWQGLGDAWPRRGVAGLALPPSELLMKAAWPDADAGLIDEDAERDFDMIQDVVGAVRELRQTHKVPPRQVIETTAKAPAAIAQKLLEYRSITCGLANTIGRGVGPDVDKPAAAAVAIVGAIEIYAHGIVDTDAERQRLTKRADELAKQIKNLEGRLANKAYVEKAPEKLVNETREQLTAAQREAKSVNDQLAAL